MIEPIKPGDELYPLEKVTVDELTVVRLKAGWSDQKEVDLNLRTIDYFLQFPARHGAIGLINMIEGLAIHAGRCGTVSQNARFAELTKLRESWIQSISALSAH